MTFHPATPSVIQPALLSRMNERQVLRAIQAHGPMSRAEVARFAGISAPTASKVVVSLLASGWLEEGEAPELMRGRPARKLFLPELSAQVLGLVIDTDQCRLVSAGLNGCLREDPSGTFATPATYAELLDQVVRRAEKLVGPAQTRTLGMGISLPGLMDHTQQRGLLSPNVAITNEHTPAYDLAQRLGMECVLLQESNALCLAERYYGNAIGLDNFAMLDASTGVGLGVMSGGQLLTGHRGLAGEVGHITVQPAGRQCGCGNYGCLETVACDSALLRAVAQKTGRPVLIDDIVTLLESRRGLESQPELAEALEEMIHYLAIGVAAVINMFNPSTLFVHSRLLGANHTLFTRMLEAARKRTLAPAFADCHIVQARGSKRQGAVAGIIEHLLNALVPSPMKESHYVAGPSDRRVREPIMSAGDAPGHRRKEVIA